MSLPRGGRDGWADGVRYELISDSLNGKRLSIPEMIDVKQGLLMVGSVSALTIVAFTAYFLFMASACSRECRRSTIGRGQRCAGEPERL